MAAATAMMLGGPAAVGGLAGVVRGKRGTSDTVNSRQYTEYADASPEERALMESSRQQWELANLQQGELDNRIRGLGGLQGQAQDMYGNVLSGQALQATPEELMMLDNIRNQSLAQTEAELGDFVDQGLGRIAQSAGARGLRGQAMGALQGNLVGDAMKQYQSAANQADLMRMQAQLNLPYQRLAAQQPFIQQGMTYADQLRQQALDNRLQLQNPLALQMMRQERLGEGVSTNMTPGKKGSWLDAFEGGVMGGMAGAQTGANVVSAMKGMGGGGGGGFGGGGGMSSGGGGYGGGQSIAMNPYYSYGNTRGMQG